jgi:rhodanese-related sulfurtransferase
MRSVSEPPEGVVQRGFSVVSVPSRLPGAAGLTLAARAVYLEPMKAIVYAASGLLAALITLPAALETWPNRPGQQWQGRITQMPAQELAARLIANERLVFIDVREPREFAEFHIPGAVSIPLRHIYQADLDEIKDADFVIPYCLKDFRGFEGARALADRGLTNVVLVEGFGIKSWKRSDLPVAGERPGLSETEAMLALRKLLMP